MTQAATDTAGPMHEANVLRETERARLRALVSADVALARQFHAPDFQLITPIGVSLSRDEYLGAIAAGRIKYLAWEPADIAVRLYEGSAVIRYRAQLEVVFDGHNVPLSEYWHTDAFEYHDDRWMVVWSQATSIR
ncbi:nuclear transport factor 2 family protein [Ensifer sp. 4252]|uniref:nuclear transport factor 2 family protein n=1 Tax=Ensifer sp. 4252 TaxID=3373915 RepID=UPI003D256687